MNRDVLIADDTEDMRVLMRMLLTASDYSVVCEASDGQEALTRWREHRDRPLCAVVLDHRMPEMTGLEVAEIIREERPGQHVIICSAFVDDELTAAADALGVPIVGKKEISRLADSIAELD